MYSRIRTMKSTNEYLMIKKSVESAECVIIGAGAGLSAAAGYEYGGARFREYFADFEEKYGFHDMYSGGFYPYETLEEYWAYWSRYVLINRYIKPPKPVYDGILNLVRDKDYFVITTNVDHCFQRAGFDKERLFYTQGDYGLFQCSEPCCAETFDNEKIIREMVENQRDMRIPSELIPYCPHCGKPLTMNLRADDTFVEDEGWHIATARYAEFLRTREGRKTLYLELGVGFNTPAIIKYPFWKMTAANPKAVYACVNKGEVYCPREIKNRSILVDGDIAGILELE